MINKDSLIDLLQFVEMTNKFAVVYRKTILNKDNSFESDSQHSFQLALVAWYINDCHSLNLSNERLMKYALVHDLVEVYSGDLPAYGRSLSNERLKKLSERNSMKKLVKNFSRFKDLSKAFKSFFELKDQESKFIYALDKMLPLINIELNNNSYYLDTKTTYDEMIKVKAKKIEKDPIVNAFFTLLGKYLLEDAKFFWPDCKQRDYSNKDYF